MPEDLLITIFCSIDDFCTTFEAQWKDFLRDLNQKLSKKKPSRTPSLSLSEVLTIALYFHKSHFRTFKHYYDVYIKGVLRKFFPKAVSYSRIIRLIQSSLFALFCYLQSLLASCTGVSFIDSTLLTVCHLRRASSHKVFKGLAKKGKTSTGWFYGFKLHLVINERGDILAYQLTTGNTDDRKPVTLLTKDCFGKLFGDKGYLSSQLFEELYQRGLQLITKLRSNMKNKLMKVEDKLLLKSRGVIESVNDRLKNGCQIEHHRHRSVLGFLANLVSGLAAYQIDPHKPSLRLSEQEMLFIQAVC